MIAGLPKGGMRARIRVAIGQAGAVLAAAVRRCPSPLQLPGRLLQRLRTMNLILLCRDARGTRHIRLSPALAAGVALSALALLAASTGLGFLMARSLDAGRLTALQHGLLEQQQAVAQLREAAEQRSHALALRVAGLHAQFMRLNALGSRLAGMARLDDGEFDFSVVPGTGGEEEAPPASLLPMDLDAELDALQHQLQAQRSQLSILAALLVDHRLGEEARPQGHPLASGYLSSGFGARIDPFTGQRRHHRGVDIAASAGTEIRAAAGGIVSWAGAREGYGRVVEITHGNGYMTRYAHNARNLVGVGERVQQGDAIALLGASGRATGPHLHFEVWQDGRPVDPQRFIRAGRG